MRDRLARTAVRLLRGGSWLLAGGLAAVGVATVQVGVATLALCAAAAGGLAGCAAVRGPGDLASRQARAAVPMMVGAIGALVVVLVVAGLAALVGATAVPIAATVVAVVLWRRFRWAGVAAAAPGVAGLDVTLASLSDGEMARAWRRSHRRLALARDGIELERVSELRRRQLDEMERRDPVGFGRWVGSGTWVTGDSAPFLRG